MSALVKLASKMPADDDLNGLDATVPDLLNKSRRDKLRAAVVFYNVDSVVEKTDPNTKIPKIAIRRFEPIGEASEVGDAVLEVMSDAVRARTGREPLPFDTVEVVEQGPLPDSEA